MQSEPVSPPPITTTCLPPARISFTPSERLAGDAPVLLRQEIHREMDAVELAAGDRQIARLLGAAGQRHRVVFGEQLVGRQVDADMDAVMEGDALGLHLLHADVDDALLHLEVGNAVAQQAAGLGEFLEDMHVVAGARELLRAGHAGRARADDGDFLAGLVRGRLRLDPAALDRPVDDRAFDGLDGDRVVVDVERAGRLARRRADAAGDFREIVGREQIARGLFPVAAIDEIVPVRDLVVDRAAVVTIRNAAIHAARGLLARFLFRQRQDEFAIIPDPLLDRRVIAILAFEFEKAGDLTHVDQAPTRELRLLACSACHFLQRAAIFERHHLAELAALGLPVRRGWSARAPSR